ncbi:hypothetical protein HN51_024623, partial [Arachis hypogaea]
AEKYYNGLMVCSLKFQHSISTYHILPIVAVSPVFCEFCLSRFHQNKDDTQPHPQTQ